MLSYYLLYHQKVVSAKAALLEHYDWLMFVYTTWSAKAHLPTAGACMSLPACQVVMAKAGLIDGVCKASDIESIFQVYARAFVVINRFYYF